MLSAIKMVTRFLIVIVTTFTISCQTKLPATIGWGFSGRCKRRTPTTV